VKFCAEVSTILRVKDPLAAVWPFLGIVAEVSAYSIYCIAARARFVGWD
jgi:hypothetical protein